MEKILEQAFFPSFLEPNVSIKFVKDVDKKINRFQLFVEEMEEL